ncbi:MAG: DNA double-strand break repair nuclease NurA [Armatimonadetes bacterium]|nr:DNA double-strand break repair nuclease NurA [Armatimonadota bacterium]
MLDLDTLVGEMHRRAADVVRSAAQGVRLRDLARQQLAVAAALPRLRDSVLGFGRDMAVPLADRKLDAVLLPPPAPDYTVIATDGSQVAPDYHHIAPWGVINAGCAVFRYGPPPGRARCRLDSLPRLLAPGPGPIAEPQEELEEESEADALAAAGATSSRLEAARLTAELELAVQLVEEEADPGRTVLLLDGPLVQWRMLTALKGADQDQVRGAFQRLVQVARRREVGLAGYISRSRAVEWVTLLRFSLCPEVQGGGSLCTVCRSGLLSGYAAPAPGAHHAGLAGLRDIDLARAVLLPGERSRTEVVELKSATWDTLSGGESRAGFFYLDTGIEIARVELTSWTWEKPSALEHLHGVLADQCEVGAGYPLALAEAHEAAVVRAADREMFYTVLERVLNDHGVVAPERSAKGESKRRPQA